MGRSRELVPRAAALVCTLWDIKRSCRYVIELFSSSLYFNDHDTLHNLTFIYFFNVLWNASKTLPRFLHSYFLPLSRGHCHWQRFMRDRASLDIIRKNEDPIVDTVGVSQSVNLVHTATVLVGMAWNAVQTFIQLFDWLPCFKLADTFNLYRLPIFSGLVIKC